MFKIFDIIEFKIRVGVIMDNNEEKNIPTNDFEIIDIPNAEDNNQTVNNNQFEQTINNNGPVEQINVENIQPSSTNI